MSSYDKVVQRRNTRALMEEVDLKTVKIRVSRACLGEAGDTGGRKAGLRPTASGRIKYEGREIPRGLNRHAVVGSRFSHREARKRDPKVRYS